MAAADAASAATLRALAAAFRTGQLAPPVSAFSLSKVARIPNPLAAELQSLTAEGMSAAHLALVLDARADTAEAQMAGGSACELVWTGPESAGSHCRDTSVVIENIFSTATRSVIVSSYVVQGGDVVFRSLAARMQERPDLRARMFLHVARKPNDTRDESELLREFAVGLKKEWPGSRRPEVFYDPRTLSADRDVRASWHAKCVLADDEIAFVTSANFTEWAQQRNVEAGVLIRGAQFSKQLRHQFDGLVQSKLVRRLAGF